MRRYQLGKRCFLVMNSWKLLTDKDRKMKSDGREMKRWCDNKNGGGRAAVNAAQRETGVFFPPPSSDHMFQ